MKVILKAIWLFQRKLILASIAISIVITFLLSVLIPTNNFIQKIGISYIFVLPLVHFYTYELRNSNEYYFYYNLGLSKLNLWIITVATAIVINIILSLV